MHATTFTAPAPMTLVRLELRKLVNTRAVVIALTAAALLAGAVSGGQVLLERSATLGQTIQMAGLFTPYFLVGIGAALVATEFRENTALTTFALVPRRGRILAAKGVAMTILSILAAALMVIAGVLVAGVAQFAGLAEVAWTVDGGHLLVLSAGLLLSAAIGWALGCATGSVAFALAAYLIWPMVSTLVGGISPRTAEVLAWLRPDTIYLLGDQVTSAVVGQTLTGLALWLVLPAVIGWLRITRGEIR